MIEVTKESVEEVLKEFKELIDENRYQLESGKDSKNDEFIRKYMLKPSNIKSMLERITVYHCINVECHHKDKSKVVYKFVKEFELKLNKEVTKVPVYIKFFLGYIRCQKSTVIISFHEAKYSWKYMFK